MDEATLRKLDANPHYTLSKSQREELERIQGKKHPIEPFNMNVEHNNTFNTHDTYPKKRTRTV